MAGSDLHLEAFVAQQVAHTGLEQFVEAELAQMGVLAAKTLELPQIPDAPNERLKNLWRELVFRGVSSSEPLLEIQADWNPAAHPRGPDGQFVERPWDIPDDIMGMDTSDIVKELAQDDPDFLEKAQGLQVDMEDDLVEVAREAIDGTGDDEESGSGSGVDIPETVMSDVQSRIDSEVDLQNTENPWGFESLNFEESKKIQQIISEELENSDLDADGSDVDSIYELTEFWKSDSYTDDAQTVEKAFSDALGISDNYRNDTLDGRDPTRGEIEAAAVISNISRRIMKEKHGDEMNVERGIQKYGTASLMADFLESPDEDSVTALENTIANYSIGGSPEDADMLESVAERFASDHVSVEQSVETDEMVAAPDAVQPHVSDNFHEGEVWIPGGENSLDPEKIFMENGLTMSQLQSVGIDEWGEDEIQAVEKPLIRMLRFTAKDEIELSESHMSTLEQIKSVAEDHTDITAGKRLDVYIGRELGE